MLGAAPSYAGRLVLLALLAVIIGVDASPARGAFDSTLESTRSSVVLPREIWAVSVDLRLARDLSRTDLALMRLRGADALILKGRTRNRGTLARLERTARSVGFLVVSPISPRARRSASAACRTFSRRRPGSPCAVYAKSAASALRLATEEDVDLVIFPVRHLRQLRYLRGATSSGRVIAVTKLGGVHGFRPKSWREAIRIAAGSENVEFAVMPSRRDAERSLGRYLRVLSREKRVLSREKLRAAIRAATQGRKSDRDPPSPPSELRLTSATASSVAIEWQPSQDNRETVLYAIYRDGIRVGISLRPSVVLGRLSCGTTYVIEIAAVDLARNRSPRSAITVATTPCGAETAENPPTGRVRLGLPTVLRKTGVTHTSISLSWRTVSGKQVRYDLSLDGALLGTTVSASHRLTGLSCGTRYLVGVRARDKIGNLSLWATLVAFTSACAGGPAAPKEPAAHDGAVIYVSPAGSDESPCTQTAPCASFDRAYRAARPGQVVEIAEGAYPGQTIKADPSKTSPEDVIFRPAQGATVVIGGLTINASHLEIRNVTVGATLNRANVDVRPNPLSTTNYPRDVTLRDLDALYFNIMSSKDVTISGGDYGDDDPGDGVYAEFANQVKSCASCNTYPENIVIEDVTLHHYRSAPGSSAHTNCLSIRNFWNVTIRRVKMYPCDDIGLSIQTDVGWTGAPVTGEKGNLTVENVQIECCLSGFYAIDLGRGWGGSMTFRNIRASRAIDVDTDFLDPLYPVTFTKSVLKHPPVARGCSRPDGSLTYANNVWTSSASRPCTENGNVLP